MQKTYKEKRLPMPYKNPEAKKAWSESWREHGKENGYNKYLYARRKLRFDDAEEFRAVLTFIAEARNGAYGDASIIAKAALAESQKRHDAIGSPREHSPRYGRSDR